MKNGTNIKKTYYYLKKNGVINTFFAVMERVGSNSYPPYCNAASYRYESISSEERQIQRQTKFQKAITFSILVPMYETNEIFAKAMIQSVLDQTYGNFELILADASKTDVVRKAVEQFEDERIHYFPLEENDGISENTNKALEQASGQYIGLLDHDDLLTGNALYEMAIAIEKGEKQQIRYAFLYSDEDKCDREGAKFYDPNFKEEFNYDLIMSNNYICHFLVMEANLMKKLRFRKEYDGAQDYDLVLRAYASKDKEQQIAHIDKVLYHWRCHEDSTAANPQSKQYAYEAGRRAVEDFLVSQNITGAKVEHTKHNGFYRVAYWNKNDNMEERAKAFFTKRKDAGIIAGPIYTKNKITGGIYDKEGNCPYAGLNKHYSGYLHRAVLQQNAHVIDIRNMVVTPELYNDIIDIIKKLNGDLMSANKAVSDYVLEKGYRLVWDPIFQGKDYTREENWN